MEPAGALGSSRSPLTTALLLPADEDHGEGERHLQRGQAHGRGRALAGLSAAGVLQPGLQNPKLGLKSSFVCFPVTLVSKRVFSERHGETQRPPSDALHGPG